MPFKIYSQMIPAGDQPKAIDFLVNGIKKGHKRQTLLGVTGSGKTFTIANVIEKTQLPTLVISHNKTLAGQLYQEFKELFPKNKVSYFVSYYDFYQPEAYIPASDTYIAKEVEINDLIDKLRLEATSNLFLGSDNIIIASVSCIYNIGDPIVFSGQTIVLKTGDFWHRRKFIEELVKLFYVRSEIEFKRSTFRIRGEIIEIWPSSADWIIAIEFDADNKMRKIVQRNPFSGTEFHLNSYRLFPAKQFVGASGNQQENIYRNIRSECAKQVALFKSQKKILEAHRLEQRVEYDLEMLKEVGYVNGIENYSIYFESNRRPGDPPYTLIDYFRHLWGNNFLTIIDESHVSVPQIQGMYRGDFARKQTLVDFGFRLPSAFDNRPLKWEEFNQKVENIIYVSATPSPYEIDNSQNKVVEQIIRPTGLIDPPVTVRSTSNQIPDLVNEIKIKIIKKERVLVLTITKKMAEELAAYLGDTSKTKVTIKVAYLHSDIETLERSNILDKLRAGDFDVLVGINLLREGLDIPEVSLVAILDASSQGFLRSRSSLIQIMGRASRHINGQVILYADEISLAMREAIKEVNRRRQLQIKYNSDHHITPKTISKSIRPKIIEKPISSDIFQSPLLAIEPLSLTPPQRKNHLSRLKKEMRNLASNLQFEQAIKIRDKIREIESI